MSVVAPASSFLGKAGPLVLARTVSAGVTVLIPLVLTRALALPEFGTYKQLLLVAQTLHFMLPFGVAQSLYYFLPRTSERRAYLGQTLVFLTGVSLAAVVLLALLGGHVSTYFSNPELLRHRVLLAVYVVGTIVSSPLEIVFTAEGRTKVAAGVYLGSDAARTLAMVLPVLAGQGLAGLMAGMAGWAALRALGTAWLFWRHRGAWFSTGLFVGQLKYAAPFGAAVAITVPQLLAHQYAVSFSVSPEDFAIYAVACFQLPLVNLLLTPVSEVLMVRVSELDSQGGLEEGVRCYREATAKLAYAFLPLTAFCCVAAPELITALFGSKYQAATPLYQVGVLATALAIFPVEGVLRATGRTAHIFSASVLKAVSTVPIVYAGVRWFGMEGAMASSVITEVIGVGALMVALPAALGVKQRPWREALLMPWMDMGKATAAALGAAMGVWALRAVLSGADELLLVSVGWRWVPLFAAAGVFGAGYLFALRLAGVRPLELASSVLRGG
ncbi:MAG: lipopolysaccharide biosynthesis protein [Myxococcota bacterium]